MSTPVVLVAGESLVDVLTSADGTRTEHPGGSPANVAVALARLGTRVRLLTAYAADRLGSIVEEYVGEPGVELAADPHVVERTSSAVATLDATGAASYTFDISGVLPEPDLSVATTHLHVGSIGAVNPPGADLLARLVERLAPTATISYDINARPSAVPLDAATRARIGALVAASDVVKASDEDLAEWLPDLSLDDAAAGLVESGAGVVVVTLGRQGHAATRPRVWPRRCPARTWSCATRSAPETSSARHFSTPCGGGGCSAPTGARRCARSPMTTGRRSCDERPVPPGSP